MRKDAQDIIPRISTPRSLARYSPSAIKSSSRLAGVPPLPYGLLVICGGIITFNLYMNAKTTKATFRNEDEPEGVVALKIANTNWHRADNERAIEQYIAEKDPSHCGLAVLRTSSKCFEISGPEGRHVCLAYKSTREPLWLFPRRFIDGITPCPIIKAYIRILLVGLDYLHTECKMVHAGV